MLRKMLKRSERGQAIVLIAVGLVALIVMIGLMADGGVLFIEYGRLKRGIDAAAISAALQYRENYTLDQLTTAATEFLKLNQIDISVIKVETCDNAPPGDTELCTSPQRKLVRVTASRNVDFSFLTILGFDRTTLTASSVGEAASVDVVLVIDTSASMAFEGGGDPNYADVPEDDPSFCNPIHSCQPLEQIKATARDFINYALWFPYDRAAIITFDRIPHPVQPLTVNGSDVLTAIDNLTVFQPDECIWGPPYPASPSFGPCLNYDVSHSYIGLDCPRYRFGPDLTPYTADDSPQNPSSCTSSNIGGALKLASAAFYQDMRENSLWVVILLAGGPANTGLVDVLQFGGQEFPDRICPPSTWSPPWCRDASASSRHLSGSENYDADDYARDRADLVADPVNGQGAVIFSIGLGKMVRIAPSGDADAGEQLLRYAAEETCKDLAYPCGGKANHGYYYFAPTAADLREIFRAIADNIATILSR